MFPSRNMLVGKQVSAEYGKVSDIGYFPDAFGNIGQAPQILRGFDIGGLTVSFGKVTLTSIACALILGICTNLLLSRGCRKGDKVSILMMKLSQNTNA